MRKSELELVELSIWSIQDRIESKDTEVLWWSPHAQYSAFTTLSLVHQVSNTLKLKHYERWMMGQSLGARQAPRISGTGDRSIGGADRHSHLNHPSDTRWTSNLKDWNCSHSFKNLNKIMLLNSSNLSSFKHLSKNTTKSSRCSDIRNAEIHASTH